jgi:hypothetical protein
MKQEAFGGIGEELLLADDVEGLPARRGSLRREIKWRERGSRKNAKAQSDPSCPRYFTVHQESLCAFALFARTFLRELTSDKAIRHGGIKSDVDK